MIATTVTVAARRIGLVMLAAATVCALPAEASQPAPPVETASLPVAMLVDLGSGQVLDARNPDKRFLPASITKVMTAFVAFEEIERGKLSADARFTVSPQLASEWSGRGTSMYLQPGEQVRVDDLLRGIMTASANDASVVLAHGHAGSIAGWAALMNDAARRLGMTGSHFANPSGWPDQGRTFVTARDLIRLASAMIRQFPSEYSAYSGHNRFVWRERVLFSHDPVSGVVEGADGIKTGYTREAGYNFLGSARRDGRRLVMVAGGARSEDERARASRALLEWGFAEWRARPLFDAGEPLAQARVQGGTAASVPLAAAESVYATIPKGSAGPIRLHVRYDGPVAAPVAKGQRLGVLEIRVGDLPAGHVPLVATKAVGKGGAIDRLVIGLKNLIS